MKTNTKNRPVLTLLSVFVFLAVLVSGGFPGGYAYSQSFKLPAYEKFTLENGLTVYLMEHHEVPLIYVSIVFPAGAVKDNGKYGLASLTAEGLLMGTKNYTKKQIEEELDYLGASYSISAGQENASVFMSFLNTDRDKVFPLLKEIVIDPAFRQEEFEKRKKRLLLELEQAREKPYYVIGSYYNKFLFGDHGYGNPVPGTRPSVEKIGADDLKAFYRANYNPEGSAIAVVGDFQTPKMKAAVKKLFKNWQSRGKSPLIQEKPLPDLKKSRVLLVNKEDAIETRFMIGGRGIERSNPDFVAVQVVNTILGGRFTSWLNDELRVNAGLTYGVYSFFTALKTSGTFTISSYTRTAKTVKALDLALEVMNRLHTKGIDRKTLTSAKNYIKGQYPPRYETAGNLAGFLTSMFTYGFDESFIDNFQENVDSMTVEKTREIIKKYFPGDNLQFVLIGKAREIRDQVKKYGEIIEKEIKADGF